MWNPFKKVKDGVSALVPAGKEMLAERYPAASRLMGNDAEFEEVDAEEVDTESEDGSGKYVSQAVAGRSDGYRAVASMVYDVASNALDVYRTSLQVEQNIAAIRAASDVKLAEITQKFEFCKAALDHVFRERHTALSAHYSVLDDAMKTNDRELVISALRGISSIVVTSPLPEFRELVNKWDSYSKNKPLELDF